MYALAIIGLLTTVISAFYYLRIIKIIYFDRPKKPFDENSALVKPGNLGNYLGSKLCGEILSQSYSSMLWLTHLLYLYQ